VAQSLLAIQLNLEMMRARVKQGRALDDSALDQLVDESKRTVDELRRVARDLRPETLERMTLAEALRWLAEQCQSRAGLRVALRADETADLSPAVKDHLYRICQEVLKNVVTHAKATEATLQLARRGSLLELTIRDNGCGFDAGTIGNGLGLASVRERAQLLGGMARIDSSPGRGTKICITVPA
jgi:signal transduction histidine kinase